MHITVLWCHSNEFVSNGETIEYIGAINGFLYILLSSYEVEMTNIQTWFGKISFLYVQQWRLVRLILKITELIQSLQWLEGAVRNNHYGVHCRTPCEKFSETLVKNNY